MPGSHYCGTCCWGCVVDGDENLTAPHITRGVHQGHQDPHQTNNTKIHTALDITQKERVGVGVGGGEWWNHTIKTHNRPRTHQIIDPNITGQTVKANSRDSCGGTKIVVSSRRNCVSTPLHRTMRSHIVVTYLWCSMVSVL